MKLRHALLCLAFLPACGVISAANQMDASKAAYKQCLAANPTSPDQCAGLKAAYDTDLNEWKIRVGAQ